MKKHEKILFLAALLCAVFTVLQISLSVGTAPTAMHRLAPPDGCKLNVNTADAEALELLPGIGPVLAEAILTRRAELGSFSSRNALLTAEGIGEARLSAIEAYITY